MLPRGPQRPSYGGLDNLAFINQSQVSRMADAREAFEQAVAATVNWEYGDPEPRVSYEGRVVSVEGACYAAMRLDEPAPYHVCSAVNDIAERFRAGAEAVGHSCDGPKNSHYVNVAECLLRLYRARQHYFERVTKERSER